MTSALLFWTPPPGASLGSCSTLPSRPPLGLGERASLTASGCPPEVTSQPSWPAVGAWVKVTSCVWCPPHRKNLSPLWNATLETETYFQNTSRIGPFYYYSVFLWFHIEVFGSLHLTWGLFLVAKTVQLMSKHDGKCRGGRPKCRGKCLRLKLFLPTRSVRPADAALPRRCPRWARLGVDQPGFGTSVPVTPALGSILSPETASQISHPPALLPGLEIS